MSDRVISELGADFLVLGRRIKDGELSPDDARSFKAKLLSEVSGFEAQAQSLGATAQDIDDAKYAIMAFMDEMILSSDWEGQPEWSMSPLQADRHAGERFFQRLNAVRTRAPDVLGLYYDCLALGYEGMYGVSQDRAGLQQLTQQLQAELLAGPRPMERAPAYAPADFVPPKGPWPWALVGIVLLVLSLVGWGIMKTTLESRAESAVDKINRAGG